MPREIRDELQDLLDSGHHSCHSCYDIVLTDGEDLFLSTGEILVNRFGKNQQYLARIKPDVGELSMSTDIEVDGQDFKATNVDFIIGQLLTTGTRRMDGASAIIGSLFIDIHDPTPLTNAIWDAKMKTTLVAGEIGDEEVSFSAISQVDLVVISGRTIANEFQWQEPISVTPISDPSDIPGPMFPDGEDPRFPRFPRTGRYGEMNFPMMP